MVLPFQDKDQKTVKINNHFGIFAEVVFYYLLIITLLSQESGSQFKSVRSPVKIARSPFLTFNC
jgi:hypothetical protein